MNATSTPDLRVTAGACPYCSTQYSGVIHGGPCPKVKAIEYHPSGAIKRVEFEAVESSP